MKLAKSMPQQTSETGAKSADRATLPSAVVCHRAPGRFRVRVPECRRDQAYFERAKEALEQEAAVLEVTANPFTGSILVLHQGDEAVLLRRAESIGLFRATRDKHSTPTIVHWLDNLDRFDTEFLFARMSEEPQRAATGLFMLAVLQALRGSFLPSAPSLLGEAMRLLRESRAATEGTEPEEH